MPRYVAFIPPIKTSFPVEFTKQITLFSKEDLLEFCYPRAWVLAIVSKGAGTCEKCKEYTGTYDIEAEQPLYEVFSLEELPPYHPNCRCFIKLKLGTGTYDIDPSFPQSYTITVLRHLEEIEVGTEEQFWVIKEEFDKAFREYAKRLPWGPVESFVETSGLEELLEKAVEKITGVEEEFFPKDCAERAYDVAGVFKGIVEKYGAQRFVNIEVKEINLGPGLSHAWVEVKIKYLSNSGSIRVVDGFFDAWLFSEPKWSWEQ